MHLPFLSYPLDIFAQWIVRVCQMLKDVLYNKYIYTDNKPDIKPNKEYSIKNTVRSTCLVSKCFVMPLRTDHIYSSPNIYLNTI